MHKVAGTAAQGTPSVPLGGLECSCWSQSGGVQVRGGMIQTAGRAVYQPGSPLCHEWVFSCASSVDAVSPVAVDESSVILLTLPLHHY